MTWCPGSHPSSAAARFLRVGRVGGAFEELCGADGASRPAWESLLSVLGTLGPDVLAARAEDGRRLLREHGVTLPIPGDAEGADRPWEVDFLPLVFGSEEWGRLESGLLQRARLLNTVLQDLYSQQRLVRDGFLPAALLFANPGYLRACQAIRPPEGTHLHIYAADLARSPDGHWTVLADRTQAPAGFGFAQECRTVTSRVLPEAIQAVQPLALAPTLRIRREHLRRLAPQYAEGPTIVVLSPGPRSETWFEHAYLARHLGFTLVEGDDLTVRDHRVFIKTLDGLRRVHVILRRVFDAYCDPLELRGDSLLGVPGLVESVRSGEVVVTNALGSGLLEGPAFLPFLPAICRRLFDKELLLPSVGTWWCGQAAAMEYAGEHADELVFRPAFSLAGDSTPAESSLMMERLRQRPHDFVGQRQVLLSRMPVAFNGHWDLRPFVLRLFVVCDGDHYRVMPGGLARVVSSEAMASVGLDMGGICKDVWVLAEAPSLEHAQPGMSPPPPVHDRAPSDLPSRTADNFYWLGRYTERLEQLARALRCTVGRLTDQHGAGEVRQALALGRLLGRLGLLPGLSGSEDSRETLQSELLILLHKEDYTQGIRGLLRRIHQAAFAVRYRLSADTWRILTRLEPDARQRGARLPLLAASSVLNSLVLDLAAFSGMEMENMTRGHGWMFLDLGRRVERALSMAQLLESLVDSAGETAELLEPALEIADSVMTYRRRYFDQPRMEGVLDLLWHEPANPRSIAFQLDQIARHGPDLPVGVDPQGAARVRQLIADLTAETQPAGMRPGIAEGPAQGLARVKDRICALSELISQVYFSHVLPRVN